MVSPFGTVLRWKSVRDCVKQRVAVVSEDKKRPDTSSRLGNARGDRFNLTSLEIRRSSVNPEADIPPLSEPPHSPDQLASSIQAGVSEIAVIWMLHRWSLTQKAQSEPLHQQIKDFSSVAFDAIVSRFPALKDAKEEHLWLIYFKGLLTAGTHPREEMTKAIQTVGAQKWIRVSPAVTSTPISERSPHGPHTQSLGSDPSDADALEQISRALGQWEPHDN